MATEDDEQSYPDAPARVHERVADVLRTRGKYAEQAHVMSDQLAEDFFDEKIAPYLLAKGLSPDRLTHQRGVFCLMVVQARAELRSYGR